MELLSVTLYQRILLERLYHCHIVCDKGDQLLKMTDRFGQIIVHILLKFGALCVKISSQCFKAGNFSFDFRSLEESGITGSQRFDL